jgi:hypothetical protein
VSRAENFFHSFFPPNLIRENFSQEILIQMLSTSASFLIAFCRFTKLTIAIMREMRDEKHKDKKKT